MPFGTARSSVERTTTGWTISGAGELGAPANVSVRRIDVTYSERWQPHDATLEMATAGEQVVVHGGFDAAAGTRVDIVRDGRQVVFVTATVAADALVLPSLAFGAYEALAASLESAAPGRTLNAYVLPHREMSIDLQSVRGEVLAGRSGPLATRRWRIVFRDPAGAVNADVWVARGRLVRLDLPDEGLSVVRSDVTPR
jgi:hypothetical protein